MESYIRLPNSTQHGYEKIAIFINSTNKVQNTTLVTLDTSMIQWLAKREYLNDSEMVVISHVKHKSQSTKNIAVQLIAGCNIPPDINNNITVNKIIKRIIDSENIDNSKLSMFTLDAGNGHISELIGEYNVSQFTSLYL